MSPDKANFFDKNSFTKKEIEKTKLSSPEKFGATSIPTPTFRKCRGKSLTPGLFFSRPRSSYPAIFYVFMLSLIDLLYVSLVFYLYLEAIYSLNQSV